MQRATLTIDGKQWDFPIVSGTVGNEGIDISRLRQETGYVTLDPGLGNTGSCISNITYIDGERGILRYRGIPIEEFSKGPNFVEVAWMLIFGRLPNLDEYERFSTRLTANAHLHEGMRHHFQGFPVKSPPMAMLAAMFNVLACYHPEVLTLSDDAQVIEEAAARLISKVRTIAAYCFRHANGLPVIYPSRRLHYAANFLHMMFSHPDEQYIVDEELEEALNLILILHADHEQNCSTSTVRVVGSSQANLFTSVAAGVSALWGPLHGGANVAVMDMLSRIHDGGLTAKDVIEKAKDKNDPFRLMGFGHRVYKNYDPRAKVLANVADRVLKRLKRHDPLLDVARALEEEALKDSYFVERKLYPNVDFYSGIIMRAMGIPTNMFTVLFAMGRLPGWIAHWYEQHIQQVSRIYRPRQVYQGPVEERYRTNHEREEEYLAKHKD
jgi:citrate synthase